MKNLVKNSLIGIFIISCFFSCSIHQKKSYANSCIIDFAHDEFILTKQDSVELNKIYAQSKKFADSCEKYNLNCLIHAGETQANFIGGYQKFYKTFNDNFKLPKNSSKSTSKLFLTIGKNDNIKSYKMQNIKDKRIKKEIKRVLNLKEMNKWRSANIAGIKCDFIIEFNICIVGK
ncbi:MULTISPECIES: hypothetical protein [Flavobacterium]|uniref:hypothetical protein n=1 Tax=Flavobacterium TaxID=237 RepID=UPI001FCA9ED7|nr:MULTISPECIES: hypothetical protein [Flavobacterium]UOK42160.1 hypothetical protein LZF87_12680 [Flavobacterium enshiense]